MTNLPLLSQYLKNYKIFVAIICVTILVSSFTVLSIGEGIKYVIDHGFLTKDMWSSFSRVLYVSVAAIFILSTSIFARICLISYTGESIIADIRINAYSHLLKLSQSFFEKKKVGSILSTLISDTATLQLIISGALSNALRNIAMLIGSMIMLVYTNIELSLYSFIMIPAVVLSTLLLTKKVRKLSKVARDSIAIIASYSEETLNNIKIIQAFTYEKNAIKSFSEHVRYTSNCFFRYEIMRGWLVVLVIITVLSAVGLIFWLGNNNVINGHITYGELSAFMFYMLMAANSTSRLGEIFSELQQAKAAIQRLGELFSHKTTISHKKNATKFPKRITNITFTNVSFSYTTCKKNILSDLSFTINRGEHIAIIGLSGAGKSTIFNLLLRFYDVENGTITINGHNIKDFAIHNLRKAFSIVPQDSAIFSTSIMENIMYGDPEGKSEEVISAANNAHATDFINKLQHKFDSFVGEKGIKLSGGQKQRIAIARAIIRNAQVLLLDEATASLDTEHERMIQNSLHKMHDITIITIAHRLSTVINADRIIVLDNGKVVDIGSHEDLLKSNDLYARLIELQSIK